MKTQFKELKGSLKRSTNLVTQVAHESWSFTMEKSINGVAYAHSQMQKIGQYFKSEAYEQDLDQVIDFLHIHKPSSKPNFDKFSNRNERVFEKSKYVKIQAVIFVGAIASIGAEIGSKFWGLEGAAAGFAIGTAAGVVIVTVVAGGILVKRIDLGIMPAGGLNVT
jgi:hypothetical protein